MFYKFIDENTIKPAPHPLTIGDKYVFTNSERTYNEQGYYRLKSAEYPQDENVYVSKYVLKDNVIVQSWKIIEETEV